MKLCTMTKDDQLMQNFEGATSQGHVIADVSIFLINGLILFRFQVIREKKWSRDQTEENKNALLDRENIVTTWH